MDANIEKELRELLLSKPPMLFLGAGFSVGSTNSKGDIPLGDTLKEEITTKFFAGNYDSGVLEDIKKAELPDICQVVDDSLKHYSELRSFLKERFCDVIPADFHYQLSDYPWKKIYTVNIDDLVEHIYQKSDTNLTVQNRETQKPVGDSLQYIKLHGCVNGSIKELVFSRKEYNNLINGKLNFKHNDLVMDIQNESFIFIGASMDEPDINFYITRYEDAGYFRKGKIIFVEPKPSFALRSRIEALSGTLAECTAEEFLNFVSTLNYNPQEQEKSKIRLNYSGIFLYKDLVDTKSNRVYRSRLYQGYDCTWQDVTDDWLFESPFFVQLRELIDTVNFEKEDTYCIAIYGKQLVGKGCILKQAGAYLSKQGYTVLEYTGKRLDIHSLFDYMRISTDSKFVLLVEDASYYYKIIESIYNKNNTKKKLLIITTSRVYYHLKKKYYLEGTPYAEFEMDDKLDKEYAKQIYNKLKEKGFLSDISRDPVEGVNQIVKKKFLVNLLTDLTYGSGFQKRIQKALQKELKNIPLSHKQLFRELVIFEQVDLPYYPSELMTAQYAIDFYCFREDPAKVTDSEKHIVDYVRVNDNGIMLKNKTFINEVWKELSSSDKMRIILNITRRIAPYVSEHVDNYWRIMFESLLKEDVLEQKLSLSLDDICDLYYQLNKEYDGISYYWLQMGIVEQRKKEYNNALNHLLMAKTIRKNSYQIQHAIARNYLKYANNTKDSVLAQSRFDKGKELMLELINSTEYHKSKAKNYSIHCYVSEWIQYLNNHNRPVSNSDVRQMKQYIDKTLCIEDRYVTSLIADFMKMLSKNGKMDVIHFKPGDKYMCALGKSNCFHTLPDEDALVDSY